MKILSIIIPTYNMESLLKRNIDSLVSTNKELHKNLDIIIVNDGSKDKSLEIANTYKEKYPECLQVIDKENGNYGSCVNAGLDHALGIYVKILDADDWFDTKNLEKFIIFLTKKNIDCILTDYKYVLPNGKNYKQSFSLDQDIVLDEKIFSDHRLFKLDMHGVTYKRDILNSINYKQTTGISYTDQEWIYYPMSKVKTLLYYPISIYQYALGRDGQTMDPNVLKKKVGDNIIIIKKMIDYYVKKKWQFDDHSLYFKARILGMLKVIYKTFLLEKDMNDLTKLYELDDYIKERAINIYNEIDNMVINARFLPIKYISNWHESGKKPSAIVLKINAILKNIQNQFIR